MRLAVFDAAGRRVQVLRDGELPAGAHREVFSLRDEAGRSPASGLAGSQRRLQERLVSCRFVSLATGQDVVFRCAE